MRRYSLIFCGDHVGPCLGRRTRPRHKKKRMPLCAALGFTAVCSAWGEHRRNACWIYCHKVPIRSILRRGRIEPFELICTYYKFSYFGALCGWTLALSRNLAPGSHKEKLNAHLGRTIWIVSKVT